MKWNTLHQVSQLENIYKESAGQPVLIFKHSTRCSTSRLVLDRLQRNWKEEEMKEVKLYFLDLLTYRDISNAIQQYYGVVHQSPQVLIIRNGQSVFNCSHFSIDYAELKSVLKN
jgi:bacillithiol system protein YtxJ